jgi:hypothetical protein
LYKIKCIWEHKIKELQLGCEQKHRAKWAMNSYRWR